MKMTLAELRRRIRRELSGSQPDETYTQHLLDDPAFAEKSVYVPDDIKTSIKKWAKAMKLTP